MTASENSGAAILRLGSYAGRGRVGPARRVDHAAVAGEDPARGTETMGTLLFLPLPRTEAVPATASEGTPAAPPAAETAGARTLGVVRAPETARAGAAVGAAAAAAVVYALGRRAGRRGRGPVARFPGRPF
ncbi:hypothetical protein ACF09E_15040 [Streptomyces sp. NPDC014891]|uniref:hypothetical protein n=1 Tax=Streptomyces sp. NPDC014891 TaxID=3364929 RepID=UPI0036F900F0